MILDKSDLEVFFLTFRNFISTHELIQFMFHRFKSTLRKDDIATETVQTLLFWTKNYLQDFNSDDIKLIYQMIECEDFKKFPEIQYIYNQLTTKPEPSPIIDAHKVAKEKKLEFLTIAPSDLARQLTILEFRMFEQVEPLDLVTTSARFEFFNFNCKLEKNQNL